MRRCGFGDINKKTVEGVVACWLVGFVSSWAVLRTSDNFSLVVSPLAFDAILATVITFVETFSPRGTDDGFGTFSICLTAIVLWRRGEHEPVDVPGNATAAALVRSEAGM